MIEMKKLRKGIQEEGKSKRLCEAIFFDGLYNIMNDFLEIGNDKEVNICYN